MPYALCPMPYEHLMLLRKAIFFKDASRRILYLVGHWLPLAFVPAIAPSAWLMTVFPLLVLLLQVVNQATTSINTRYTFAVIPG